MDSIFKVGDIVRIRDLRELEKKYGALPFCFNEEMYAMKGGLHTITDVVDKEIYDVESYEHLRLFNPDGCKYRISGDSGKWSWSSPMLELVTRPTFPQIDKMFEHVISEWERNLSDISDILDISDKKKEEHKLELKVKNVRKVKLNFKN